MEWDGTEVEGLEALSVKAENALSTGDWETAAAGYEALVRSCPDDVKLRLKLARAYEKLRRPRDVIDLLTHPTVAAEHKSNRMLAKTYLIVENHTAAKPLLDELIAASPNDANLLKWHALCDAQASADRLAEWMEQGQALFSSGRLEEAEQIYLKLLTEFPEVARAHFRLGQIRALKQRWADAVPPLRTGLAIEPGNNKIRMSLALALFKRGKPAEVIAVLNGFHGGDLDPNVLFMLQRCHMKLRHWAHVDQLGGRLLAIVSPEHSLRDAVSNMRQDALVELATAGFDAISRSGDFGRAILVYRLTADRYPGSALAWLKLGRALAAAEQNHEAVIALRKASGLRPDDIRIRKALTRVVLKTSEDQEILRYVQDAIAAETADSECHRWLAQYHNRNYHWLAALESARNALAVNSEDGSARFLVARALMRLSRLAEALDELDVLLKLGFKSAEALELKADIFVRLVRLDDAIGLYREAYRADPNRPMIGHRISYALLLKGDIAGFHRYHEKRRETGNFIGNNKNYPYLDWDGELVIAGKLLVWSEFGLGVGQNILHMTFLKPLTALGLDVVVAVEPRLVNICRRSFPDVVVVANDAELPAGISHHTPIGSLSRWFKPDLESFASIRPYFMPDVQAVAGHRNKLQGDAGHGQLLVGISWTSNNPFVGDVKSVQLDRLLEAISLPGVTLVNLQYGDHSQSIAMAEAKTGKRLLDSGIDNSNDLDGLTAVVAAMDLVVCIGHTTAHITGAVGTPNFVLLPAGPFAHWLAQGEKCIWYPATTFFRQAPIDEVWEPVLGQVGDAVGKFVDYYDPESWLATTLLPGLRPLSAQAGTMSPQEIFYAASSFAAQGAYRSALTLSSRLPPDHLTKDVEMQRADILAHIGRWHDARAILIALRPGDGTDPDIERNILNFSLDMHDLENALPIARSLADDQPAYRMTLATILYRLRRHNEALAELRTVSLQAPQMKGLSTLLGTILLEMGAFECAETYLTVQAAINRRTEDYTLLGRSISAQGRREEALLIFEKAVSLSHKNADPAANFWRTQERIELGIIKLVPLPPLLGGVPNVAPDNLVIFFVADSTYFWEHGLVLLGSLGRHSPRANCHVHVINPDAGVARAIEIIRGLLADLKLSYSYEYVNFEDCSAAHVRTYYASVRFVRLAEIFARSPATYLCLDADGVVRDDVEVRECGIEIADIGIRMRFDERPQMGLAAGASIWRPTVRSTKFISRASTLIQRTLEAREAVWFLDQVVLNHVYRELAGEVAITQLDMTYLDWFFNDDSLVWTGKGGRKSDDNQYIAEVSNYRYLHENEEILALMPSAE